MDIKRILITGGAGFVGSSLARSFKATLPDVEIIVFDNLHRRGSEGNIIKFPSEGIHFVHGDIRCRSDFDELAKKEFDVFIEASAEPSVLAGLDGNPSYVIDTNLLGTLNCLELARHNSKCFLFLSTSRVYSIEPLKQIRLSEDKTRFNLAAAQSIPGVGPKGISESFPTSEARSLYGATKLASEIMIQEYSYEYNLPAIINRCGVICGAGQFGKVDQGVFALWMKNHVNGEPLKYTGFGGTGKQVRDLLSPKDLFQLLLKQLCPQKNLWGKVFNVGGGIKGSTSLLELTELCKKISGKSVPIAAHSESASVDIPLFISDNSLVETTFGWKPSCSVEEIMQDIFQWLVSERTATFGKAA